MTDSMLERVAGMVRMARERTDFPETAVAFAILKEMREPTTAMCENAGKYADSPRHITAENVWQAMIDAALKETP